MLYLIDCITTYDNILICKTINNTNKRKYIITIDWNDNDNIKINCNCNKKTKRNCFKFNFLSKNKKACEHIRWLGNFYLNSPNPKEWNINVLDILKERKTDYKKTKGKNIECLICMENIDYNKQNTINCHQCNYSIHNICWNEYLLTYPYAFNNCTYCKTRSMPLLPYLYLQ